MDNSCPPSLRIRGRKNLLNLNHPVNSTATRTYSHSLARRKNLKIFPTLHFMGVSEHVSIVNFHYNWPNLPNGTLTPQIVSIGFDESGFAGFLWWVIDAKLGQFNAFRRRTLPTAWIILFLQVRKMGSGINEAPGGGSTAFRSQLKNIIEAESISLNLEKNFLCKWSFMLHRNALVILFMMVQEDI